MLRIQIPDPVPFRSLDPGWVKIKIREEHPGSATLTVTTEMIELRTNFRFF